MKKISALFVILSILNSARTSAQSMNCATATQLTLNNGTACVNGTNVGAISNNILFGGCNASPVNMVWYTYVSNGSNNSFTVAPGTLTNPMIVVYLGGCPGTGTLQNCVTAAGSNTILTGWGAALGTQVWIGIASTSLNDGTFQFCVKSLPTLPGAGNICAAAIPVCNTVFTQPTIPNNVSGQTPNCFVSPAQQDVWIKFTIKQAGTLAWTATPNNPGTEFDWCLWDITAGCPGIVACCNYNYAGGSSMGIGMQAQAGTVACGYNLATGVPQREFCPPMNVVCGKIYALQIDNYNFNNSGFSLSFLNSTCLIQSNSLFAVTPTLVCGPSLNASITNSSTGACGGQTWNYGDGSPTYNGLFPPAHTYTSPGTYAITASIPGVCPSATTQFVQLLAPLAATVIPGPINCFGQCTGTAGISAVTGGNGVYTYSWSTGSTSNNVSGLCAGIYSVTISNTLCGTSITKTVSIVAPPALSITGTPTNATCGNSNGSISVVASGGTPSYSFSINGGAFSPVTTYTGLAAGAYTMTAIDTKSCQVSVVLTITQTPGPTVTVNSATACAGMPAVLTATGATSYSWSPGAGLNATTGTSVIATVSNTTTYTVVGTLGGCSSSATAVVSINAAPNPTATSNSSVCVGNSVNFFGSGGVTYTWTGPGGYTSVSQNPVIAIASATNAGTYTLTVTGANSCVNYTTTNVVINPLPVPTATSNSPVCLNTPIYLMATGGSSYTWSGPLAYVSAVQNPTINNSTLGMSGQYTVLVTSAASCTASAVTGVTVYALPSPTITSNSPVCVGSVLSLTASGGSNYNWTGPNSFTSALTTPVINNVSMAAGGVYTLLAGTGNCTVLTTSSITINPLPNAMAGSNSPVCLNQTLLLNSSGGAQYLWAGPNGYSSASQNPTVAIASMTNNGIYTVTVTDANLCVSYNTTSVVINSLPILTVNNPTACVNANIAFISSGANNYSWSGPLGYSSLLQNPNIGNASLPMSGQYTLIGTSAAGCTNTAFSNVVVSPSPTATINGNNVCIGGNLTLNGSGGSSYSWSGPNGFISTNQNNTINNVTFPAGGNYSLIVTVNTCTSMAIYSVVINPLPTPLIQLSSSVCFNQPITFTASGGVVYAWSGPGGFNVSGPNPIIPNSNNTNSGMYTLTATDANGCVNSATASVLVKPLPLVIAVGSTVCLGHTASLTANSDGVSYSWTGPNGFSSAQANNTFTNFTTNQAGDYILIVTGANQCTISSVANVTNYPSPTPTASNNGPVCLNGEVKFESSGGLVYNWIGPNGFISNSQNTTLQSANSMNYSGTYTLGVIDDKGCQGFTTTNLIVRPLPTAKLNSSANKFCVPFCSDFSIISTSSLQSVQWEINGGDLAINQSYKHCFDKIGEYVLKSSFTDMFGCSNTGTLLINAYPLPIANFYFAPGTPVENDQIDFADASMGPEITNWTWYFATNENFSTLQNPNFIFENATTYPVALVVTNKWGCKDTIVKPIVIGEGFSIYVPNAFTPNGDGVNDLFQPKGYGIKKYNLMVFDRWGEKLFFTEDFFKGWDGTYKGNLCKDDTYTWKIAVQGPDGKTKDLVGIVTLLK